jgi:hypothetical protein
MELFTSPDNSLEGLEKFPPSYENVADDINRDDNGDMSRLDDQSESESDVLGVVAQRRTKSLYHRPEGKFTTRRTISVMESTTLPLSIYLDGMLTSVE